MMLDALNVIDYVFFGLVIIGAIIGAYRGMIEIVSKYAGYVAGLVFAVMFTKVLASFLREQSGLNLFFSTLISYVSIYLVSYLLIKSIGNVFQQMTDSTALETVDQILGFFLGVLITLAVVAMMSELIGKQSIFDVSTYMNASWSERVIIQPVQEFIFRFAKELV